MASHLSGRCFPRSLSRRIVRRGRMVVWPRGTEMPTPPKVAFSDTALCFLTCMRSCTDDVDELLFPPPLFFAAAFFLPLHSNTIRLKPDIPSPLAPWSARRSFKFGILCVLTWFSLAAPHAPVRLQVPGDVPDDHCGPRPGRFRGAQHHRLRKGRERSRLIPRLGAANHRKINTHLGFPFLCKFK